MFYSANAGHLSIILGPHRVEHMDVFHNFPRGVLAPCFSIS